MTQQDGGDFSVYLDDNRRAGQDTELDRNAGQGTGKNIGKNVGKNVGRAFLFQNPVERIIARNSDEIIVAFERMRHCLKAGYYVAGWISYEAGLSLEDKLAALCPSPSSRDDVPLLSFGVYQDRLSLDAQENDAHWAEVSAQDDFALSHVALNISRCDYEAAVAKIHDYLAAGDIYQVNYTLKYSFEFAGRAESYYAALRKAQKVEFGAFIKSNDLMVLSRSPELFFQKKGRTIITRPMKGTCSRGRTLVEDQQNIDFLQNDEKNRAENLMIVDLLRNDLAKIASPGSVKLKSLYDVEEYQTLFTMTSTIEAKVPTDVDAIDLFRALFPCGSVTGAPKIRAMEIISALEADPRGIYTGAIGYIAPDGDCCFSVPIRTVVIGPDGRGEMGIGGAIVADSKASAEYDECILKAQFATVNFRNFDLIETMLWKKHKGTEENYHLLALHMARLSSSARYFDFFCDGQAILNDLRAHESWLDPSLSWKIRLLLSRDGEISLTSTPLEKQSEHKIAFITLSDKIMDSQNPMLFHKTTDRQIYNQALACHQKEQGSYDVIFVNEAGEITEGTFNNIFLKQGDILYTPPLACGVLGGTLRQSLMEDPAVQIIEKRLTPDDLHRADKIYMGNSVRGLVEVTFKDRQA